MPSSSGAQRRRPSSRLLATIAGTAVVASGLVAAGAPGASATGLFIDAQIVSGEAFLSNGIVEIGTRDNASYGSDHDAPVGYHPRTDNGNTLGFVSDRDKDGWGVGTDDGDFFTPGSPFEGWALQVDSGTTIWNTDSITGIAGTNSNAVTAGGSASVTWDSTAPYDGVSVKQVTSIAADSQTLVSTVTLTNTTGSPIADVYYSRAVDPDNCVTAVSAPCTGDYSTTNTLVQQKSSGDPSSVVSATATDGSYIDLRTDADSVVGLGSCSTLANAFLSTCGNSLTKGATVFQDSNIFLVARTGALGAGEAKTITIKYVLSASQAAEEDGGDGPSATAPERVTKVSGDGKDRAAKVTFEVPSDGGSQITSYQYRIGSGAWKTVSTRSAGDGRRSFTISGLTNGRSYLVSVRAVNAEGSGAASHKASVFVNADEPAKVKPPAKAVPVPKDPKAYHGKKTYTKARWTSKNGTDAWPAKRLGAHQLVKGEAVTLNQGLFTFNESTLTGKARSELKYLAKRLRAAKTIVCEGYTDYAGSDANHARLGKGRAANVCSALKAYGADVHTKVRNYKGSRPVQVGGSATSRDENRRVVVKVLR